MAGPRSEDVTAALAVDHSEALGAEVTDQVLLIETGRIAVGERLRDIDPVWAEALGQVMLREGQRTPIEVCRLPGQSHWTLVAGAHRHAGAEAVGIEYLRAIVVTANRDERRQREISENLWRKDLEPIDRAAFIAELVAIRKRSAGIEADSARVRHVPKNLVIVTKSEIDAEAQDTLDTISNVYGWSEEIAAQLGFSGSTVRRDLFVYRRLAPSLVQQLRTAGHPAARNATHLRSLAKLTDDEQARAVAMLLDGDAATVPDAVRAVRPKAETASASDSKLRSRILGTLQRMSARERLALCQDPHFHQMLPIEAQRLLAPMRRDGGQP
jgi:hypothetical protein